MKKVIAICITAFCSNLFWSCTGTGDKSAEKPESVDSSSAKQQIDLIPIDRNCAGTANLLVEKDVALEMIGHYDTVYRKINTTNPVKLLSKSVWINKLIIHSFGSFFEKPAGKLYDGVRFINIAKSANAETVLLLVPTKPDAQTPGYHVNQWGNGIVSLDGPEPNDFFDYNRTKEEAGPALNNFEKIYRKTIGLPVENRNPLSSSIWVDACVFSALKAVIDRFDNDPVNRIDGVNVYFGAYKDMSHHVKGQFDPNQSTILLVPTNSDGNGGHTDNWDVLKKNSNYGELIKKFNPKDAFNHGELCPQQCNADSK